MMGSPKAGKAVYMAHNIQNIILISASALTSTSVVHTYLGIFADLIK